MSIFKQKSLWGTVFALPFVFLVAAEPVQAQTAKKEHYKRKVGNTDLITTGSIVRMFSEGDTSLRGPLSTEGDADIQLHKPPEGTAKVKKESSFASVEREKEGYVHDASRPDPRQKRVKFRTVGDVGNSSPKKSAVSEIISAIKGEN